MKTLYHYTTTEHLESIRTDGYLRTTDSVLLPGAPSFETRTARTVVWLTDSVVWRQRWQQGSTADKSEIRFVLRMKEEDVHHWREWARMHGSPPRWMAHIERTGGGKQAANHWFVVEHPISVDKCSRIEWRDGGALVNTLFGWQEEK